MIPQPAFTTQSLLAQGSNTTFRVLRRFEPNGGHKRPPSRFPSTCSSPRFTQTRVLSATKLSSIAADGRAMDTGEVPVSHQCAQLMKGGGLQEAPSGPPSNSAVQFTGETIPSINLQVPPSLWYTHNSLLSIRFVSPSVISTTQVPTEYTKAVSP